MANSVIVSTFSVLLNLTVSLRTQAWKEGLKLFLKISSVGRTDTASLLSRNSLQFLQMTKLKSLKVQSASLCYIQNAYILWGSWV